MSLLRLKTCLDIVLNLGLWLLLFGTVHKEDGRRQVFRQLNGEINLVNAWHKTAINNVIDARLLPRDVLTVFEFLMMLNPVIFRGRKIGAIRVSPLLQ